MVDADPQRRARAREWLAARVASRLAGAEGVFGPVDLQILLGEVSDLEGEGRFDAARQLLEAGVEHARAQSDQWVETFLALRITRNRASACDEAAAASWLCRSLGADVSFDPEAWLRAAELLVVEGASGLDITSLRAGALYAAARVCAMAGRLALADVALSRVLTMSNGTEDPFLDIGEVAVFLGEIRLDLGDLAGLAELADAWQASAVPLARRRWQLLQATVHHLEGRLSLAESSLREILESANDSKDAETAWAARWQLANVLGALNRLGEALGLIEGLRQEDPTWQQLSRMLCGRMSIDQASAAEPRRHFAGGKERRPTGSAPAVAEIPEPPRAFERYRQECAWRGQQIRIALHEGDLARAVGLLAWLLLWTRSCDSPLVRAECDLVRAHVMLASGHPGVAARDAVAAEETFAALGLPAHQREACLIQLDCLSGNDAKGERAHCRARSDALLLRIHEQLSSEDKTLYKLNKWAEVDERIAAWLEMLAPATPGSAGRRRNSQRAYKVLCRVASERGWDRAYNEDEYRPVKIDSSALPERVARRAPPAVPGAPLRGLGPRALPKDTALLYYVLLPDRLAIFTVAGGRCWYRSISSGRVGLWELSARFLTALRSADPNPRAPYRMEELRRADEMLGRALALTETLEALPPRIRHLRIVPDDILVHVPFAALTLAGEVLCTRYSVALVPYPRWVTRRRGRRLTSPLGVAVTRSDAPGCEDWRPLPRARDEILSLKHLANRGSVRLTLLDRADDTAVERVGRALPDHDLVHFACHGEYVPTEPDASGLLLQDRWLTVREIESLHLERVRVAVLGSCWSANTRVLPGREMVGIATSFIRRGCRALVTCLWQVADEVAPLFAEDLYADLSPRSLPSSVARVQAKWSASQRMSGTPAPVRPRDWAPYVVYENGIEPRILAGVWLASRLIARRIQRVFKRRME